MNEHIHKKSLSAALQEISNLIKERDQLESHVERLNKQIGDLTQAVEALGPLCDVDVKKEYPDLFWDAVEPEIGLTDAVRKIMSTRPIEGYSAVALRDKLTESGFDMDKYTNPMANIHTILKRLVRSSAVNTLDDEGRTYYIWN